MNDDCRLRILPVLDLKDGMVVRGVGGKRDEYRPVVSQLTASSEPLDLARALSTRFGFREFYVADLGAICEWRPHWAVIDGLLKEGFELLVDAGIRNSNDCEELLRRSGVRAVLGLETMASSASLQQLVSSFDPSRLVFSLDLMHGRPIADESLWPAEPIEIAEIAVNTGLKTLIVLDLAAVGGNAGCPTLGLCQAMRLRWPEIEIVTGGGVRSEKDLKAAVECGADRVLVSSALHDGRIG